MLLFARSCIVFISCVISLAHALLVYIAPLVSLLLQCTMIDSRDRKGMTIHLNSQQSGVQTLNKIATHQPPRRFMKYHRQTSESRERHAVSQMKPLL
jgi:hypothetical protein